MNEHDTIIIEDQTDVLLAPRQPQIVFREIKENDIASIIELLKIGFPNHRSRLTEQSFQRLRDHPTPPSYPKYGYLLEYQSAIVGVLITIFTTLMIDDCRKTVRCNLSSWYVMPRYRSYAGMLSARALRRREVTYLNISPHPGTLAILEAQGFQRYCNGIFISAPALKMSGSGKIEIFDGDPINEFTPFENQLLLDHRNYGCISVICIDGDRRYPFVFATGRFCRAPAAHLTYCRSVEEFVRFGGPLGRFLIGRGHPLVIVDADRPIPGLIGKFYDHQPKFFKGPDKPDIGDLAYTERPLVGI
jgi:hypothetical protein